MKYLLRFCSLSLDQQFLLALTVGLVLSLAILAL